MFSPYEPHPPHCDILQMRFDHDSIVQLIPHGLCFVRKSQWLCFSSAPGNTKRRTLWNTSNDTFFFWTLWNSNSLSAGNQNSAAFLEYSSVSLSHRVEIRHILPVQKKKSDLNNLKIFAGKESRKLGVLHGWVQQETRLSQHHSVHWQVPAVWKFQNRNLQHHKCDRIGLIPQLHQLRWHRFLWTMFPPRWRPLK